MDGSLLDVIRLVSPGAMLNPTHSVSEDGEHLAVECVEMSNHGGYGKIPGVPVCKDALAFAFFAEIPIDRRKDDRILRLKRESASSFK